MSERSPHIPRPEDIARMAHHTVDSSSLLSGGRRVPFPGLVENLREYNPTFASDKDLRIIVPKRVVIKPHKAHEFEVEDHQFIHKYQNDANLAIRSGLAQAGAEMSTMVKDGKMRVLVANFSEREFVFTDNMAIGSVYKTGTPIQGTALLDVIRTITQALPDHPNKEKLPSYYPGEVDMVKIPIVKYFSRSSDRDPINMNTIPTGTDRQRLGQHVGIQAQPTDPRRMLSEDELVSITESVYFRLPASHSSVALIIESVIGTTRNGDRLPLTHLNSRLLKPYSSDDSRAIYEHGIRFETIRRTLNSEIVVPSYALCYATPFVLVR